MAVMEGGAKLDAFFANLASKFGESGVLEVGFFEGATYPDGTSVPTVAFWNEFGTKTAPPRPFFRHMIAEQSPGWGARIAKIAVFAEFDTERILQLFGETVVDDLRESIIKTNEPALSPTTLMLRKMKDETPGLVVTGETIAEAAARVRAGEPGATGTRAKPLIDTAHMIDSVGKHVEMGSSE